jgi:Flp pilus assembly protein TadG
MRLPSTPRGRRPAATTVECAVIYPLTFLLILGLVITAQGVARYQEVAALARDGARYASTHGAQYRKDTGEGTGSPGTYSSTGGAKFWYSADPTQASGSDTSWAGDIYDSAVRPKLVALDPTQLNFQVGYPSVINQPTKPDNWPGSQVSVTVKYNWLPQLYVVGPIQLSSTSSMAITN